MFFGYTRASFHHLKKTAMRVAFAVSLTTQLFYIAYLTYALIVDNGILGLNIGLCALSTVYLIYFIVKELQYSKMSAKMQETLRRDSRNVRRAYSYIKLGAKTINLAMLIYGIYVGTKNPSTISTIITTLMIILWVLEVIIAVGKLVLDYICDIFIAAFNDDVNNLKDSAIDAAVYVTTGPLGIPINRLREKLSRKRKKTDKEAAREKKFEGWEQEYKEDKRENRRREKEEDGALR